MSPGVLDFSEAKFLAMQNQNQKTKTKTENPLGAEPTSDLRAIEFDTSNFDLTGLDDDAACSQDAHAYDPDYALDYAPDEPATTTTPPEEPEHVTATLTAEANASIPANLAPLDPDIAASVAGFSHLSGTLCDPSCEATPEASEPDAPAATTTATTAPEPAPAAPTIRTKGDVLRARIEALETDILELDREEHDLAERLSATRKSRKELLSDLRDTERSLTALGPRADEPDESHAALATGRTTEVTSVTTNGGTTIQITGRLCGVPIAITLPPEQDGNAPTVRAAVPDPALSASLSALGLNEKQLEKFAVEGIRTVAQFEKALADRSIEAVKGIQERTMDKIKDALIDWRNKHGYGSPAEVTVADPEPAVTPEAAATSPASEAPVATPETPAAEPTPAVEPIAQPAWFNVTPDDPAPAPEAPTTAADATPHAPAATPTPAANDDPDSWDNLCSDDFYTPGYNAALAGKLSTECPNADDLTAEERADWDRGWQDGFEFLEHKRAKEKAELAAEPPAKKKRGRKPKATAETAMATATAE